VLLPWESNILKWLNKTESLENWYWKETQDAESCKWLISVGVPTALSNRIYKHWSFSDYSCSSRTYRYGSRRSWMPYCHIEMAMLSSSRIATLQENYTVTKLHLSIKNQWCYSMYHNGLMIHVTVLTVFQNCILP
jgi:hypothetical protein